VDVERQTLSERTNPLRALPIGSRKRSGVFPAEVIPPRPGLRVRAVFRFALPVTLLLIQCTGCGAPNQANIALRKENQQLKTQLDQLRKQRAMDADQIAGLQARIPTEPTLPPDQLAKLVTTHGIRLGRLTGGQDIDPDKPGDEGLKVYVITYDETGQEIKAAGTISIEAFDLAAKEPRLGKWDFNLEQAKQNWYGQFLIDYYYAVVCPWQTVPQHADITVKVTFVDELTKLPFTTQKVVHVMLPPAVGK
jgi:hypothetical protein